MEAILNHIDYLIDVMNSKVKAYKELINAGTSEEIRAIILVCRTCMHFKWLCDTRKLKPLKSHIDYDQARQIFLTSKAHVKCSIYAVTSRLTNELIQHVINIEDE